MRKRFVWGVILLAGAVSVQAQVSPRPETFSRTDNPDDLVYHTIKTDSEGKIIPWYSSDLGKAYDHHIRQIWLFWKNMRNCENGVPYYFQHQVWKEGTDDNRGLGGDQLSMALSSWNLLYGYTGDESVKQNMTTIADYWLTHGFTPANAKWANVPFPYNTKLHSGMYDGDMRAGAGFLQPDKAASFGDELVTLYKLTGNRRYLEAATKIADTLAEHVIKGDAENSPWPFRVNAMTDKVHEASKKNVTYRAAYTTNWTGALNLFAALKELKTGQTDSYAKAHQTVIEWIKTYPLKTNKWGPFFEDIMTQDYSDTEINADTMATYILNHPEWGAERNKDAAGIINWTSTTFANDTWKKYGVIAINEQTVYRMPGNSHTSRHASVELLYCEKTGDCAGKELAIRRLNWATYMVAEDGRNRYPKDDVWLTDGYGDYVRHYLRAMASTPELAPRDENHLLRTTSVIQNIIYSADSITYRKFDVRSQERFKLGAWEAKSIKGGKMKWDPVNKVLEVKSSSPNVTIYRAKR